MMSLELASFPVREASFGSSTRLEGEHLVLDRDGLLRPVRQEAAIRDADLQIVHPGESTRVIHVCDVIEPRLKVQGPGSAYPGILSPDGETVGQGRTNRLAGLAVVQSAEVPRVLDSGTGSSGEAFFDMTGPGALSPFSDTVNVVLCLQLVDGLSQQVYEHTVKQAGFRIAEQLAETTRALAPARLDAYALTPVDASLPRVVYLHQQLSWTATPVQAAYFYGQPLNQSFPTLVHPNELLDGALTSMTIGGRGIRAPTWMHVNNPVVRELYAAHGQSLNFLGVVLMRTRWETFEEKRLIANQGAKLAQWLGADGALVTWNGAGNAFIEAMLTVEVCEQLGIKTVLVTFEHGGPDRMEPPAIYFSPLADAVVSTGTRDLPLTLPAVERVVGGDDLALAPELPGQRIPAAGEIEVKHLLELYGSVDVWGFGSRRCLTC